MTDPDNHILKLKIVDAPLPVSAAPFGRRGKTQKLTPDEMVEEMARVDRENGRFTIVRPDGDD